MHEILFKNGSKDHLTRSNATNSWLFLIWITNWDMEPFTIWKNLHLDFKNARSDNNQNNNKRSNIEKNVMPKK